MNIEITSVYPNTWKIVKSRAFAGMAAGAIAAAAFIGIVGLGGNDTPAATGSAEAPDYVFVPGSVAPETLEGFAARPTGTYFLVGSDEQHDLVVAEQTQLAVERLASGGRTHIFQVSVADTPANESDARQWFENDLKSQWLQAGATEIQVIDLRAQ